MLLLFSRLPPLEVIQHSQGPRCSGKGKVQKAKETNMRMSPAPPVCLLPRPIRDPPTKCGIIFLLLNRAVRTHKCPSVSDSSDCGSVSGWTPSPSSEESSRKYRSLTLEVMVREKTKDRDASRRVRRRSIAVTVASLRRVQLRALLRFDSTPIF